MALDITACDIVTLTAVCVTVDLMSGMTIGSVGHDSKIGWLEVCYSCLHHGCC